MIRIMNQFIISVFFLNCNDLFKVSGLTAEISPIFFVFSFFAKAALSNSNHFSQNYAKTFSDFLQIFINNQEFD